jgi:hypothetical protein
VGTPGKSRARNERALGRGVALDPAAKSMILHDLSGLTADEFYDVYRLFRPGATREEFEKEWAEFQRLKAEHPAKKSLT